MPAMEKGFGGQMSSTGTFNRLRVLVVDDSQSARQLVMMKLMDQADTSLPLDVHVAADGASAIAMAQTHTYDVVFLDVMMPDMDGYEVCRRLKAIRPVRVAMLSGMTAATDYAAGRAAGCDNYLVKPPRDTDLRTILRLTSLRKMTAT